MAQPPDDESMETSEGDAGLAQEQPEGLEEAVSDLPPQFFDERQASIGELRKEAGPPLEETSELALEELPVEDTPPATVDESQVDEGGNE